MKIERFEDIHAWQKARELVSTIYDISADGEFGREFALRNQIRNASISIMANIAEGFDRGTNKEFIQFLTIARASCSEVKSHLYVVLDRGYVNQDEFHTLYGQATSITSLIDGFIRYLRDNLQPRTRNPEPGTRNLEPRTQNLEPRT